MAVGRMFFGSHVVILVSIFLLMCPDLRMVEARRTPVEDVTRKQLEALLESEDYLALFWYGKNCKTCDRVLSILETRHQELEETGVRVAKMNDKKMAKQTGVLTFPGITFFKGGQPQSFEGDMSDGDAILDFMTSTEALDLPDRIEEVNAGQLDTLIQKKPFLAVFFYNAQAESTLALQHLENIDQKADKLGIGFVKINDLELVDEYGLDGLPALVYYRHTTPIVFEGELNKEEKILEWLVHNRFTGDEEDVIEEASLASLETMISSVENLAVLFYDADSRKADLLLESLEKIDDDCDSKGISFVKVSEHKAGEAYGITQLPRLVYFRNDLPNVYEGNLLDETEALSWLLGQLESSSIEQVTGPILDRLIQDSRHLAVLFYDPHDSKSLSLLDQLETIDDDLDARGVVLVKLSEAKAAEDYGIDHVPAVVYFENGIPSLYKDSPDSAESVLSWLTQQVESDEIEDVTDEMLVKLIQGEQQGIGAIFSSHNDVGVLFYDQDDLDSIRVLNALENIDDDCDRNGIVLVKIQDSDYARKHGIQRIPALVYFENSIPHIYEGNMANDDEVLGWLIHQMKSDEIEDVTDEMLHNLVDAHDYVAVVIYEGGDDRFSHKVLTGLENIDDDLDKQGVVFVKMSAADNDVEWLNVADGDDQQQQLPAIILFDNKVPLVFQGDETRELDVLQWIQEKVTQNDADGGVKTASGSASSSPPSPSPRPAKRQIDTARKTKQGADADADADKTSQKRAPPTAKASGAKATKPPPPPPPPKTIKTATSKPAATKSTTTTTSKKVSKATAAPPRSRPPAKTEPASKRDKKHMEEEESSNREAAEAAHAARPVEDDVSRQGRRQARETAPAPASAEKGPATASEAKGPAGRQEEGEEEEDALDIIDESPNVIVFFYEHLDKVATKIISGLDKVEGRLSADNKKSIRFLHVDINDVNDISVSAVPSLVYFKNGEPFIYEENLMNEQSIERWAEQEFKSNQDVIEDVSTQQIHALVDKHDYVLVFLYRAGCPRCSEAIKRLEQIDDDLDAVGVKFVKTDDADFARDFGLKHFPAVVYFENSIPSIYEGDPAEEGELLTWLLYQMKEDTIENINRDLLFKMIGQHELLAVFFYVANEEPSERMLRHLELIDDEASDFGIRLVKIEDPLMAKKYGHRNPPGLGYFRQGNYIKYDGDNLDDEEILDWLTDPIVMEISDQIEKVNRKMFEKLKVRNEHLAVLFYTEHDCKQCEHVLQGLETIDDEAEAEGVPIVKLEDRPLSKSVGVFAHPSLVIFRHFGAEAVIYAGDLKTPQAILEWLIVQKDPTNVAIEEQDAKELRRTIAITESVGVFVYQQEGCDACLSVLQSLENIDDDTARQNIRLLKTTDAAFAREIGLLANGNQANSPGVTSLLPGLVFFYQGVPNVYEGDIRAEEEVLDWLIEMKVEHHIELITRSMLESMVEKVQYMAVFFFKQNCRTCDQVLAELENIDDECDQYGIQLVKLQDPQLAKRYGIKTFPSLVYFRNGNPLTYDGDLKHEESVLEWLIDDDNRELEDEIEEVNHKMLDQLLETSPFLAVFFYDDDCIECDSILESLENIDSEADLYGIDFVKLNDPSNAVRKYNVYHTPSLVFFRKKVPVSYDGGQLQDGERVLEWLTAQDVFEIRGEIVEVNRRMLEKLLEEKDFVAVYFFDDKRCRSCSKVLDGLEQIDQETDALDITFVKINDPRYAKKYGVNKLPALVYFRRKFPSIYRDDLLNATEVLDWLKKNRFKHMELDLFMYTILSIGAAFLLYTAFLMFGFRPVEKDKRTEEELEQEANTK